jgi:hypothetical protein
MAKGKDAIRAGTAALRRIKGASRPPCQWCGNTGTANGTWCPVCRPNGGGK